MDAIVADKIYTVADYEQLPEGAPYQLIDANLIDRPSPTSTHQEIAFKLTLKLGNFVEKHQLGKVYFAPLDVHLDEHNVFQPDILFIANDRLHIVKDVVRGAPDMVIEILSPATAYYDLISKKRLYGKHGVSEYWIIDPKEGFVEVYENTAGDMQLAQKVEKKGTISSQVVIKFRLALKDLF